MQLERRPCRRSPVHRRRTADADVVVVRAVAAGAPRLEQVVVAAALEDPGALGAAAPLGPVGDAVGASCRRSRGRRWRVELDHLDPAPEAAEAIQGVPASSITMFGIDRVPVVAGAHVRADHRPLIGPAAGGDVRLRRVADARLVAAERRGRVIEVVHPAEVRRCRAPTGWSRRGRSAPPTPAAG